ncbi:MAG: regulatory protein RecX [Bacteroidales bacterium]|nr:RecX family transcriptional regulator [Bacteroidales bacterium]MDD4603372.1 regulatory protein RecX [Bacteroidales bacterium]
MSQDDLTLPRIQRYCAYQERCTREVEQKLKEWKVPGPKITSLIKQLREEGFMNDERFARIFVRSKLRINKWGRQKIVYELKGRQIPEQLIRTALEEIPEEEYHTVLRELILKKHQEIKVRKNLNIREKIINFVVGKGFEFDLVFEILKELKI